MNSRIFAAIAAAAVLLGGCRKHEEVFFDTPFAYISDTNGASTMVIDRTLDNYLTELQVSVSISNERFTGSVTVEYEMKAGGGLVEGVDFRVQASTKSPMTFDKGNYTLPIRVIWYNNPGFDPGADNTLTFELKDSSVPEMVLGYPGPDKLKSTFVFTKK